MTLAPPLADTLAAVRTLSDLVPLLARLGWRPAWAVWPPGIAAQWAGTAPDEAPQEAAVLAAGPAVEAGFRWIGFTARRGQDGAALAQRAARQAYRQGFPVGIVVLDPVARQLVLAVAAAAPSAGACALDAPTAVDLARLARLTPGESDGASAARLRAALETGSVDARFFRAFRRTLDEMAASLPGPSPTATRQSYALLQLVRVLFLYFVQSRGWLDGRTDFLARALDDTLTARRPVHRRLLRTLFFGTLNRPAARRTAAARALGAVPYLNGGLFAPHALDARWPAGPSNDAWRDAFDGLFERFHFTVHERDRDAVAPDMLGRVFEGVMHPAARSRSGSFYTPAALVHETLDAGLAALAVERLGIGAAEAARRLAAREPRIGAALADITVLDPACGSGAFLLGALERLAALHVARGTAPAAAKRAVLAQQLFGVDLEPGAVRLCELRLWLSVLADEPDGPPSRVRPLPNLDALVRQGDSLLDPLGPGHDGGHGRLLATLRGRVVRAHGDAARRALAALRSAERAEARAAVAARLAERERDAAELLALARQPTLLGPRRGLERAEQVRLRQLRAELRRLRALDRTMVRERMVPWFRYETHFADIAARGGFDLVVGNPPWVRGEALDAAYRRRLSARFPMMRAHGGRGYASPPDLAMAFLERGLELAAPDGALAFLLPAKLATTTWGAPARARLAARHTVHRAAPIAPRRGAAFDATVYPMVLVAGRRPPSEGHVVQLAMTPDAPVVPQACLGAAPWSLGPSDGVPLLAELREQHGSIGERVPIALGVKTGCDAAFRLTSAQAARIGATAGAAWVRRAVRGRDVRRFSCTPSSSLLWTMTPAGRAQDQLPDVVQEHLAPWLPQLARRRDLRDGPPWALFRLGQVAMAHRVAWTDIAASLRAAVLEGPDVIALNTCYVAGCRTRAEADALAAWLNAPIIGALARLAASPAAGGCARFGLHVIAGLPLPTGVLQSAELSMLGAQAAPGDALDAFAAAALALGDDEVRRLHASAAAAAARWRVAG
jgi:hypothetical protein